MLNDVTLEDGHLPGTGREASEGPSAPHWIPKSPASRTLKEHMSVGAATSGVVLVITDPPENKYSELYTWVSVPHWAPTKPSSTFIKASDLYNEDNTGLCPAVDGQREEKFLS